MSFVNKSTLYLVTLERKLHPTLADKLKAKLSTKARETLEKVITKPSTAHLQTPSASNIAKHPLSALKAETELSLLKFKITDIKDQTQKQQCSNINTLFKELGFLTLGGVSGVGKSKGEIVVEKVKVGEIIEALNALKFDATEVKEDEKYRFETPIELRKGKYNGKVAERKFVTRIGYMLASSKKQNYRDAWLTGIKEDSTVYTRCIEEEKRLRKEREKSNSREKKNDDN